MTAISNLNGSAAFARAALLGLSREHKSIPCTWLYDELGSQLFEQITTLAEYYPTRTEISLLRSHAEEISQAVGPDAIVVEIGSGSSRKTPLLLHSLKSARAYVPIDIAPHCLEASVAWLKAEFDGLPMHPLVADFHYPFEFPDGLGGKDSRHLCFFPGSTIGNLDPEEARRFLSRMTSCLGKEALMLVGVDSTRDPAVLIPAYDDPSGVTAAFNLNLLVRMQRELGGDIDLSAFSHEARYRPEFHRVEMHLVSRTPQVVRLLEKEFRFSAGESIHTESSHKYSIADFQALARSAGWLPARCWSDPLGRFCLHLLKRPLEKSH